MVKTWDYWGFVPHEFNVKERINSGKWHNHKEKENSNILNNLPRETEKYPGNDKRGQYIIQLYSKIWSNSNQRKLFFNLWEIRISTSLDSGSITYMTWDIQLLGSPFPSLLNKENTTYHTGRMYDKINNSHEWAFSSSEESYESLSTNLKSYQK